LELATIENELSSEEVWSSPDKIKKLQQKKSEIVESIKPVEEFLDKVSYLEGSLSLLDEDGGEIFFEEFKGELDTLKQKLDDIELKILLSGELDKNNAIITIHPGAGGTESQDWAEMLMRMYVRWAERHGFKIVIADLQPGDEAGIKGTTFTVVGPYTYGYLKGEAGIHRLVRISPFDA